MKAMSERRKSEEAAARCKCRWEKLREEKYTWDVEKKDLQGWLNEALSNAKAVLVKAEAEGAVGVKKAANAEELGYWRGHPKSIEFLHKVLMTLVPDFREDSYFEAYIHYMKECQQAEAEGQDPEEVDRTPKRWSSPHPPVRRMISKMRELHL